MSRFLNIHFLKKWIRTTEVDSVVGIAKRELDTNKEVFESLRAYDEGRKNISTTDVKKHLRNI